MTAADHLQPVRVESRDNPLLKQVRRLVEHSTAYRKLGQFWVEGDHLCRAAIDRQLRPDTLVVAASCIAQIPSGWMQRALRTVVVPDKLFDGISTLESPARMGFVLALPAPQRLRSDLPTVVLDRVQDAGNVGSILRSAAAFGFRQVLAVQGTAALWAPKVLRAGMGAHFGLDLVEGLASSDVLASGLPLVVTSSHEGGLLQDATLPRPCAWIFGHEGQGVASDLSGHARLRVRIPQPGGEESLNVAAAAAICLYTSAVRAMP